MSLAAKDEWNGTATESFTLPKHWQSDVLCHVRTQGWDVVLRQRDKATGNEKFILAQRLDILSIYGLEPDLQRDAFAN